MLTILGPQDLRSCNFGSTQWIDPYSSHFLTHEMGKGNADFIHPLKISPRSPVSHFHDVSQSLIKAISLFDPEIRDGIHQLAKYCKCWCAVGIVLPPVLLTDRWASALLSLFWISWRAFLAAIFCSNSWRKSMLFTSLAGIYGCSPENNGTIPSGND